MKHDIDCELCTDPGGELLWEDALCRVVRVTDSTAAAFPGYCRVILKRHVSEMTGLPAAEAHRLMAVVFATERAVKQSVQADKINLASLGNVVPHLHWHVVPRWKDDSHFPAPIWAAAQRSGARRAVPSRAELTHALQAELTTVNDLP